MDLIKRAIFFILSSVTLVSSHAAILDASPQVLQSSGDNVKLAWQGITSPSEMDWIGIYTPADSLDDNFIGYIVASAACKEWMVGNCSVTIPLVNMRAPYQFRLFQGIQVNITNSTRMDEDGNPLPNTQIRLAASENVRFLSFNQPTQIHLSLTSSQGEMRVMFVTKDPVDCFVRYGIKEELLDSIATAESVTYSKNEMCDDPANSTLGWRDPGFIHDAVMIDLKPSKRYFYQVGSKEGGWSEVTSFISGPSEGDTTDALLFGDMGTSVAYRTFLWTQAESINTVNWLLRDIKALGDKPSFISHIGDISYARGYAWLWDEFFSQIQPLASRVPYIVCIGNHEYDWPLQPWKPEWASYGTDGGGECGVPYSKRFHMPGNSSVLTGTGDAAATKNLFFSITYGVVHFIYMSTETDFLKGSEQYEFLMKDMKGVDRSKIPFVVLLGHRPMYTSNHEVRDGQLRERLIEEIEPLLIKYRVDLVLWGHVHKYERTCRIEKKKCSELGPIHVVIGMGGQDWQPEWEPRTDHPSYPIFPQPEFSLYRSEELGYVRLHATSQLLTLSYVGNHDGEVHDKVEIHSSSSLSSSSSSSSFGGLSLSSSSKSIAAVVVSASVGVFVGVVSPSLYAKMKARKDGWRPVEMRV